MAQIEEKGYSNLLEKNTVSKSIHDRHYLGWIFGCVAWWENPWKIPFFWDTTYKAINKSRAYNQLIRIVSIYGVIIYNVVRLDYEHKRYFIYLIGVYCVVQKKLGRSGLNWCGNFLRILYLFQHIPLSYGKESESYLKRCEVQWAETQRL